MTDTTNTTTSSQDEEKSDQPAVEQTGAEQIESTLPAILDDGCPECGSRSIHTTAVEVSAQDYYIDEGQGGLTRLGNANIQEAIGYNYVGCNECLTEFVKDGKVVSGDETSK